MHSNLGTAHRIDLLVRWMSMLFLVSYVCVAHEYDLEALCIMQTEDGIPPLTVRPLFTVSESGSVGVHMPSS